MNARPRAFARATSRGSRRVPVGFLIKKRAGPRAAKAQTFPEGVADGLVVGPSVRAVVDRENGRRESPALHAARSERTRHLAALDPGQSENA